MRPILCRIGPLAIPSYAAMVALALALSWPLTFLLAGQSPAYVTAAGIVGGHVGGIFGGRFLFEAVNPREGGRRFLTFDGGMMAVGGYLGGTLGAVALVRAVGGELGPFLGAAAPSMALGLALGRVGCVLKGCDFGRPLSSVSRLPGMRFPSWRHRYPELSIAGSPAYLEHLRLGLVTSSATHSARCHPVQVYWIAAALAIFAWLLLGPSSSRFAQFMLAYGGFSLLLEPLRGDRDRGEWARLSTTQWLAIPIVVTSGSVLLCG